MEERLDGHVAREEGWMDGHTLFEKVSEDDTSRQTVITYLYSNELF